MLKFFFFSGGSEKVEPAYEGAGREGGVTDYFSSNTSLYLALPLKNIQIFLKVIYSINKKTTSTNYKFFKTRKLLPIYLPVILISICFMRKCQHSRYQLIQESSFFVYLDLHFNVKKQKHQLL